VAQQKLTKLLLLSLATLVTLTACSQTPRQYEVNPDRMATEPRQLIDSDDPQTSSAQDPVARGMTRLDPLVMEEQRIYQEADIASSFSDSDSQQVTANELPVRDFVQTIFGEALQTNYVISPEAAETTGNITLNVSDPVSSRRLYTLTAQLLDDKGLAVNRRDEVIYINKKDSRRTDNTVIGMGRNRRDVPETINPILQIIPLRYGVQTSIERTLNQLTSARINPDFNQNALFVQGPRNEILRVIDLVNLLDRPANRGKHVALQELTYVTPDEYINQIQPLLEAEGIRASTSASQGVALLMVPVEQVGSVALFAGESFILDRVDYWTRQIDRPTRGTEKRYYIYHPRYARASDLGMSVAPLLGDYEVNEGDATRDTQSAQGPRPVAGSQPRTGQQSRQGQPRAVSVQGENMRMTIDERSNSLIFFTSGEAYQSLLPIIRRLDVMPKQILLDATIAEVTLTDEFSQGFEFAFRSGRLSGGTMGRLGVEGMGGLALNWADGVDQIITRLSATSNLVNVLSNPTLTVRDGVSATISVGNDIPTIGATTSDPIQSDRQTTVINYRKTGVNLTVTPTINAQGLVVLEIDQQISNTSDSGPSLSGSPSIFERSITTEVIAQSGQTVLLGGLISENASENRTEVPGFARIPGLGRLFQGRSDSTEKTELVIFITPRVIDTVDQWTEIRARISEGLTSLKIAD